MRALSLLLLLAGLAGCSAAPTRPSAVAPGDYGPIRAYVSELIRYEMKRNSVAGLSIALVDDQHVVWAEGFGDADRERKVPATAETLYRVGSMTKLFTVTAAMQLVERRKLDLDQPLQAYLPGFSIREREAGAVPITPRLLMTHHAGLPRDRLMGFMNPEPPPFTSLVASLRDDYADYPPGRVFSYSNVGMSLLGSVVQRVSGKPYADYMRQSLLEPLGMTGASFETGASASPRMARGYHGLEVDEELPLRDVPAGGLNASVMDMSRFISMVFDEGRANGGRVLQPASVREILRPQNTDVPLDFNFRVGLGWMLSTLGTSTIENAGPVAHHAGSTLLFHSQMYILPEHKLGVVVLANSSTAKQVVDHMATETLSLALEAKSGIRQPKRAELEEDRDPIPDSVLDDYVGDYATLVGHVHVYREGRKLRADALGHSFNLVPKNDGLFHLDYALLGLIHIDLGSLSDVGLARRDLQGRRLLVARVGSQELLVGERIKAPQERYGWTQQLGDYRIVNLEGDHNPFSRIRLLEERGFLLMELTIADSGQPLLLPLQPLSEDQALLLKTLSDGGDTIRRVTVNGEERLAYSGYFLARTTP